MDHQRRRVLFPIETRIGASWGRVHFQHGSDRVGTRPHEKVQFCRDWVPDTMGRVPRCRRQRQVEEAYLERPNRADRRWLGSAR
uniref:Uncharacterized protein n=1 Tax=Panagrolaimus sp. JU765 TaxID=591449 RepID=A0AC34REB4_9BILA